ncbi:AlpA family phage regulatory protein [Acinetobacter sp. WC-323]|uniref:helix-turn-helix transcriptional regulator n=1 Tax=Acinetobacter sp. WC-323 TaxID=903918 RepID=UPI0005190B9C|nr:AlpA family phage regulatory protein [Acinetobacter sp. WC-323]
MVSTNDPFKMITRLDLEELTGLSRSTIYDRMNSKSKRYDPDFPKPVKFGHLTRWRLSEVQAWIQSKIEARNLLQKTA